MATTFNAQGPYVLGTAEAYPEYTYTQSEFLDAYLNQLDPNDHVSREFAMRLFPSTQIEFGSSPLPKEKLFQRMHRSEFVQYIRAATQDMALRACQAAISSWGGCKDEITHLVFGTMSAVIDSPTMDSRLINLLDLPTTTRRICVQQMGCLTGFRCLTLASELAAANPKARILVVVADVRSGLQNQLPSSVGKDGPAKVTTISCALFRDAASAVVVGSSARRNEAPLARVLRTNSMLLKDTLEYVHIYDGDDATIHWYNSKQLPQAVSTNVPILIDSLLEGTGIQKHALSYAMHPGGPKILHLTAEQLGASNEQFNVSWAFLKQHGNTSGSSNLALLHQSLLQRPQPAMSGSRYIMCVGIGPGLALEGLLVERMERAGGEAASGRMLELTSKQASPPMALGRALSAALQMEVERSCSSTLKTDCCLRDTMVSQIVPPCV